MAVVKTATKKGQVSQAQCRDRCGDQATEQDYISGFLYPWGLPVSQQVWAVWLQGLDSGEDNKTLEGGSA